MKRCSNELIGKCNERYHFTSTSPRKKILKQLITILKLKVCIFLYSAIPLLGFCPTEKQPYKKKCTRMLITALFRFGRERKPSECPLKKRLKKSWGIHA